MRWTQEEVEFLIRNYPHCGGRYCANELRRSYRSIIGKAIRLKIKVTPERKSEAQRIAASKVAGRSKRISLHTFLNCDTKEVAYVLGFLWADGSFLDNGTYAIRVQIKASDADDIIPVFLKTGNWLVTYRRRRGHSASSVNFEVNDKALWQWLREHGYISYRSSSPDSVISHVGSLAPYWFRGYFDGDGCFYYHKKNYVRHMSFCSNCEQDWSFVCKLLDDLGIYHAVKRRVQGSGKHSVVRTSSTSAIRKFGEYIYSNEEYDDIGLLRKYTLYQEIVSSSSA